MRTWLEYVKETQKCLNTDDFIIDIYHKDRLVGIFQGDLNTLDCRYVSAPSINKIDEIKTQLNPKSGWKELIRYLDSRCVDKNRYDIETLYEKYGITDYNPIIMCTLNHGRLMQDFYWVNINRDEITWDEIRLGFGEKKFINADKLNKDRYIDERYLSRIEPNLIGRLGYDRELVKEIAEQIRNNNIHHLATLPDGIASSAMRKLVTNNVTSIFKDLSKTLEMMNDDIELPTLKTINVQIMTNHELKNSVSNKQAKHKQAKHKQECTDFFRISNITNKIVDSNLSTKAYAMEEDKVKQR